MTERVSINVNLDPMPGPFHTVESAQELLQGLLQQTIGHYNPRVSPTPSTNPDVNIGNLNLVVLDQELLRMEQRSSRTVHSGGVAQGR